ncbi:hypothetical protein ACJJTC_008459 [Scirpophaga incertulas]
MKCILFEGGLLLKKRLNKKEESNNNGKHIFEKAKKSLHAMNSSLPPTTRIRHDIGIFQYVSLGNVEKGAKFRIAKFRIAKSGLENPDTSGVPDWITADRARPTEPDQPGEYWPPANSDQA